MSVNGTNGKDYADGVTNNGKATKLIGGVTGKGFMPGQVANPNGRPKQFQFTTELKRWLAEIDPLDKKEKRQRLHVIMERLAKEKPEILLYYAYGKPIETHEHSGIDGGAIPLEGAPLTSVSSERLRELAATLFKAAEKQSVVIELNGTTHATA